MQIAFYVKNPRSIWKTMRKYFSNMKSKNRYLINLKRISKSGIRMENKKNRK